MGTARAPAPSPPEAGAEAGREADAEPGPALADRPESAAASRGRPDPRETVIRCFLMYAEPLRSQSLGEGLEPGAGRGWSSVRVSQP